MIKQDILENQVKLVYLGIGSNLGNKRSNIEKTKFRNPYKDITKKPERFNRLKHITIKKKHLRNFECSKEGGHDYNEFQLGQG